MRKLVVGLLLCPIVLQANAGFAEAFDEYRQWIYPAYKYCYILGVTCLIGVTIFSFIYKNQLRKLLDDVTDYLRSHPIFAIIVTGILVSIPLGLFISLEVYILVHSSGLP